MQKREVINVKEAILLNDLLSACKGNDRLRDELVKRLKNIERFDMHDNGTWTKQEGHVADR